MAATSDVTDGPVLSLINKRIRALRKKQNRITQLEEAVAEGKLINKEQEDVLRTKPSVTAAIDELEKLRQPLSAAVADEVNLAVQHLQISAESTVASEDKDHCNHKEADVNGQNLVDREHALVEDLLNLLYFGSMFDVKSQNDYTSTMLARTIERGCCLTYDYVTDDDAAADLLGERDLDLISTVGGLVITRPVDSGLSHKNALQRCIEHAKLWLAKSHLPIQSESSVTYAALREKLTKIMKSDYFTTTPEMKAPVEMAAAAGNYASFQVPVNVTVQVEDSVIEYQQEDEDAANFQGHETYVNQSSPAEEFPKGELEVENSDDVSAHSESVREQSEEGQNPKDVEAKDQQYVPRRPYQNQRGGGGRGGGGHRGYSNGRGGRFGGRRGGAYQNGRNQYYDQPGNYPPRSYYNNREMGGKGGGGNLYNNHGSAVQGGNAPADS